MKLKKLVKLFSFCDSVIIWGSDNETPLFEGSILEIPWTFMNYKIGRKNKEDDEEPIFTSIQKNKYGATLPVITINVIDE